MLKRSFERSLPFFGAVWIYMLRTLSLSPDTNKFIDCTETMFYILLIPMCAFILYDKTEIELALVSGTKTTKLFFAKLIPLVTYTLIPSVFFALIFKSDSSAEVDSGRVTLQSIPEHVPTNYKLLTVISLIITVVFFCGLYSLIRVITRNCYISVLACFGIGIGLRGFSAAIVAMRTPLTASLVDPFINSYFIGNAVPNVYAEKFPELAGMTNVWTYNRLLFIGISAVIYIDTYLILRREKLHCCFGE